MPLRIAEAGAWVVRLGAVAADGARFDLAGDLRAGAVLAAAGATPAAELVRIKWSSAASTPR